MRPDPSGDCGHAPAPEPVVVTRVRQAHEATALCLHPAAERLSKAVGNDLVLGSVQGQDWFPNTFQQRGVLPTVRRHPLAGGDLPLGLVFYDLADLRRGALERHTGHVTIGRDMERQTCAKREAVKVNVLWR